jgi:hypothetical protein
VAALAGFVNDVYAPALHFAFAAAWFLALDGAFSLMSGRPWSLRYGPVGVAVFFLVLFYLRVLDEWKDMDYDSVHNPGRPLVRGSVGLGDVYWFLAMTAAAVIALHAGVPDFAGGSPWPLAILGANLAYGLLLVKLERMSGTIRNNVLVNLAVTYPVNVALSVYAYAAFIGRTGIHVSLKPILLIGAFALAFLHYEVARKTAWRRHATPGKRLYSSVLGERVSLAVAAGCAAGAIAAIVGLLAPLSWLGFAPALALLPVLAGLRRFYAQRDARTPAGSATPMTPFAMMFLVVYYATILLAGLTAGITL